MAQKATHVEFFSGMPRGAPIIGGRISPWSRLPPGSVWWEKIIQNPPRRKEDFDRESPSKGEALHEMAGETGGLDKFMSGHEVLAAVKGDDQLKSIPIIVLTGSPADVDLLRAYNLHANSYITKPVEFNEFVKVVQRIEDFWFSVVKLPGVSGCQPVDQFPSCSSF
jgi:hypothetical protein